MQTNESYVLYADKLLLPSSDCGLFRGKLWLYSTLRGVTHPHRFTVISVTLLDLCSELPEQFGPGSKLALFPASYWLLVQLPIVYSSHLPPFLHLLAALWLNRASLLSPRLGFNGDFCSQKMRNGTWPKMLICVFQSSSSAFLNWWASQNSAVIGSLFCGKLSLFYERNF